MSLFKLYLDQQSKDADVVDIINNNPKIAGMITGEDLLYFSSSIIEQINFTYINPQAIERFIAISQRNYSVKMYINFIKTLPYQNGNITLEKLLISNLKYNSFKMLREVLMACLEDQSINVHRISRIFFNEENISSISALSSIVIGSIIENKRHKLLYDYICDDKDPSFVERDLAKGYNMNIDLINTKLSIQELLSEYPRFFKLFDYTIQANINWLISNKYYFESYINYIILNQHNTNLNTLSSLITNTKQYKEDIEIRKICKTITYNHINLSNLTDEQIVYNCHLDIDFLKRISLFSAADDQERVFNIPDIKYEFSEINQLQYPYTHFVKTSDINSVIEGNVKYISDHYFSLSRDAVLYSNSNILCRIINDLCNNREMVLDRDENSTKVIMKFIELYKDVIADYITKYSDTLPNLYKLAYFLLKYDNKFFTKVIYGIE